ncbi:MAG: DUF4397 domain-containing protein [Bacteroidota bacterium]|jgi:hypothetical protein
MKKTLISASVLLSTFLVSSRLNSQNAELQVIHNSADPAAATVDIYVNGSLAVNDFAFRTATPFISLPAGVPLNVGVAPGTSLSVNDTIKNFPLTLVANQRYVAIANGVLNPASFASNPDAVSTAFTLFIEDNIQNAAGNSANVDFIGVHGSSDAPTVDIKARNVATLVDNAPYGAITNYITVPAADYILDVTAAAGNPIVVSFDADLSTLGGGSAVVFASGFLNPATNQNGPSFALCAALANGTVVTFPQTSLARLQVIHNAADPAAALVDVYVNGALTLNDFAFRTATPYIDVTAGVLLNIGVAPATSTSVNDTIKNFGVTLQNGGTYVAIANGVLNPASFAANPDALPTAFTLFLQDQMQESGLTSGNVDFRAVHGASDAPTVDIKARNVATLVNDAPYAAITGYITVPASSYILDVTPAAGSPIVVSFDADLSTLGGGSAVVFASGFLTPATNQNGPSFAICAALANGTVVTFPQTSVARLQVIHNAADPAASSVDVYINGALTLNDFAFRTATPYIDVPAGVVLNIGVAPATSTSVSDTIKNFGVTLVNGETYVAIANGVLNPASFAANPDGLPTAFTLLLQNQMRETALTSGDVDFRAVHGATDAPTVDIIAQGVTTLVNDAPYAAITGYITVPAASYILNVTPGNNNSVIVASFLADLTTLGGQSAVILASGFLTPTANQNGAAFALIAVLADGTVIILSNTTSINETVKNDVVNMYPNPASDMVNLNLKSGQINEVKFFDATGREVLNMNSSKLNAGNSVDVSSLTKGIYSVIINSNEGVVTKKLIIQ